MKKLFKAKDESIQVKTHTYVIILIQYTCMCDYY